MKTVLVAGATGYTGQAFLEWVRVQPQWQAVALVRPESKNKASISEEVSCVEVDPLNTEELDHVLEDYKIDLVASFIGTTRAQFAEGVNYETVDIGSARSLVMACEKKKVEKFILLSAVGASRVGNAYLRAKWEAEQVVIQSDLNYVIVRPSFIVGPERQLPQMLNPIFQGLSKIYFTRSLSKLYCPIDRVDLAKWLFQACAEDKWDKNIIDGRDWLT